MVVMITDKTRLVFLSLVTHFALQTTSTKRGKRKKKKEIDEAAFMLYNHRQSITINSRQEKRKKKDHVLYNYT
jgi:hypothetical protein